MRKTMAALLAFALCLTMLVGCGGGRTAEPAQSAPAEGPAPTAAPVPEPTAAPTPEPTATPEPTPEPNTAVLRLGKEELEIRIDDVHLEDGKLMIPIEGITLKNGWRSLVVEVVLDGEKLFLEISNVNSSGYNRSSSRSFEKLPEQVILYSKDSEQDALVYDVAEGRFVR